MDLISPFLRPLASTIFGWIPRVVGWIAARFGPWVPLPVAARIAYEHARATRSVLADAAERLGPDKSPAGVLNYVAHYIALEVLITGKRQPSTKRESIDPVLVRSGKFFDAASAVRLPDRQGTVFTDLCVARRDLRTVLQRVRDGLKVDTPV